MAHIFIITPNPLLDCLHHDDIHPGKVTRSDGLHIVAGGKGLNVGRILVKHGHSVHASGFAGGWTGDAFRDIVSAEGQQDAFIQCQSRLRLGFLAQNCAQAGSTALLENGFSVSQGEQDALLQQLTSQIENCDLCIVSGSIPDPSCLDLFVRISHTCAQAQTPCWIDSYGPAMDQLLQSNELPSLAKPNRQEYETSQHWDRLNECHITDGASGITVKYDDATYQVTPPQVENINPIGSGDSYIAGLAHARLSGWDIEAQLRYASAAGAVNASQMAVAEMSSQEIAALSDKVQVTTTMTS